MADYVAETEEKGWSSRAENSIPNAGPTAASTRPVAPRKKPKPPRRRMESSSPNFPGAKSGAGNVESFPTSDSHRADGHFQNSSNAAELFPKQLPDFSKLIVFGNRLVGGR